MGRPLKTENGKPRREDQNYSENHGQTLNQTRKSPPRLFQPITKASNLEEARTESTITPMTKAAVPSIITPLQRQSSPRREKPRLQAMIKAPSLQARPRNLLPLLSINGPKTGEKYTAPIRKLASAPETKTPSSGKDPKGAYRIEERRRIPIRG